MITVREARPDDEPVLLELARATMPGWVRLRYDYGTGYAAAEGLKGECVKILVVEDDVRGILGCTTRAVRECWLDGCRASVGYQSGVRSYPDARKGLGFFRGLARVRSLMEETPCALDFVTVLDGNPEAMALFTSGRVGLPKFADCGRVVTWTVSSRGAASCAPTDWLELQAFYDRESPRRQMFPFFGEAVRRRFSVNDFVAVRRNDRLVAAAAVWRQGATRRIFIDGYGNGILALVRPAVNFASRLTGRPVLPPSGCEFPCSYLAYALVENDDPSVFAELLRMAAAKACPGNLVLSLHENDPLVLGMKGFSSWRYISHFMTYSFSGNPRRIVGVPHFEAGAL